MRGALRQIVQDAVAGVEVPEGEAVPARESVPSTPTATAAPQARQAPVIPLEWSQFDPQRSLFDRLAKDEWIPEAIAAVREQCEDFGVEWTPKLPSQHWLAKYRDRAARAGRDAEADIAAGVCDG